MDTRYSDTTIQEVTRWTDAYARECKNPRVMYQSFLLAVAFINRRNSYADPLIPLILPTEMLYIEYILPELNKIENETH